MNERKPGLGHYLHQAGISDEGGLAAALADPSRLPEGLSVLREFAPSGDIVLENAVLDIHEIKVDAADSLTMRNCVVHGNLVVTGRHRPVAKIDLDHVIVTGQILIHSQTDSVIHLSNVNTRYLTVAKSHIPKLTVTSCNISHFTLEFCEIGKLICTLNTFPFYTYYENQVGDAVFDFEQIDSRNLLADDARRRAIVEANDLFAFIDNRPPYFARTSFDGNLLIKTYDFLQQYSKIGSSRTAASHYKYAATVHLQENRLMRLFMTVMGGFIYPKRMAMIGLCIIFCFSLFYASPLAHFVLSPDYKPAGTLSLFDAVYFSGVTFTTLGFGDIVPVGATKLVAVSEALVGIITTSAFLISFVRKYVDQ